MVESTYNLDKLISVRLFNKKYREDIVYIPYTPPQPGFFNWLKGKSEGKGGYFERDSFGRAVTEEVSKYSNSKYYIVEENKVYDKPKVWMWYGDKTYVDYYFNTNKEAEDFYNQVQAKIKNKTPNVVDKKGIY